MPLLISAGSGSNTWVPRRKTGSLRTPPWALRFCGRARCTDGGTHVTHDYSFVESVTLVGFSFRPNRSSSDAVAPSGHRPSGACRGCGTAGERRLGCPPADAQVVRQDHLFRRGGNRELVAADL